MVCIRRRSTRRPIAKRDIDEVLMKARELQSFQKPSDRNYRSLRRYCFKKKPLLDGELESIRAKEDMVTIHNGREWAVSVSVGTACETYTDFALSHLDVRRRRGDRDRANRQISPESVWNKDTSATGMHIVYSRVKRHITHGFCRSTSGLKKHRRRPLIPTFPITAVLALTSWSTY